MNMQRNILIAALAVITYLMILQWNKDYVDPVAEAAVNGSSPQAHTADVPALPGTPADAVRMVMFPWQSRRTARIFRLCNRPPQPRPQVV